MLRLCVYVRRHVRIRCLTETDERIKLCGTGVLRFIVHRRKKETRLLCILVTILSADETSSWPCFSVVDCDAVNVSPEKSTSLQLTASPVQTRAYIGCVAKSACLVCFFRKSAICPCEYDTIRDAILTCARTWVGLIYRTETTTKIVKHKN